MIDPIFASCTLIAVFVVLLAMGAPIGICIVIASFSTMMLVLPFDISMFATAQKMFSSLDSFCLCWPCRSSFCPGVIMNSGGIAARLVNFAKLFTGKLPGSLSYTNIVGNMMFGAISGSAIAALNLHRRRDGADERARRLRSRLCGRGEYRLRADGNVNSAHHGFYPLCAGKRGNIDCRSVRRRFWSRECCGALAVCWSRWWSLSVEIIGFSSPSKKAWR